MSEPKQAVSLVDRAASGKLTLHELQVLAAFFTGAVETCRYYERSEEAKALFAMPMDRIDCFAGQGYPPPLPTQHKTLEVSF